MKNMVERNGHKVKRDVRLVAIFLLVIMLLSGCSPRHTHQYDRQVLDEKYRVSAEVNCLEHVSYYMSCSCGEVGEETFVSEEIGAHVFSKKTADLKYLKADATLDSPEEYYKSCELCGAAGTETFFKGSKLRVYTDQEKTFYAPTSLTVTLYDAENGIYGFTYNTKSKPLRPVIQIAEGDDLTGYKEYYATAEQASPYRDDDCKYTYYFYIRKLFSRFFKNF